MLKKLEDDLEKRINLMLDFYKSGGNPKYEDVEKLIAEAKNVHPKDTKWISYRWQLNNLSSML